jgi:putative transposase
MVGGNPSERIQTYRKFVRQEDDREIVWIFSGKQWPAFFGSEKFIVGVKRRFVGRKVESEFPQRKVLAPDLHQVIEEVARAYRIEMKDLFYSRRGQYNEGRNVAIYLARRLRGIG